MPRPAAVDACPGILELHPARDGHVARIRLPGGYVTRAHWTALAGLAAEFGDGRLDLTARGNVQIRGLPPAAAAALTDRAARAGLLPSRQHDRSRNITASPLAGLGGRPPLRRVVRALDAAIVADPVLAALPGRFLLAVDDGTGGAALAQSDVGLRRAGREVDMVITGRLAGVRVPFAAAVAAATTAARAAVARGVGREVTRVADLDDGGEAAAAAIGGSLGPPAAAAEGRLPLGAASAGNGADPGSAADPGTAAGPQSAPDDAFLVAAAPLSRLGGAQAALIGGLLRPGAVLRLASAGRVVIPLAVTAAAALARLAGSGLLTSDDDSWAGVTACSGLACERAVADVRALARPLPAHPRAHWVGCPRGCGRPPDAELIVAEGPDRFLAGGRPVRWPPAGAVLAGAS
ncbi:MAG TPA: precorrin-3B synthase [Streptosporangiaceae bacterium]